MSYRKLHVNPLHALLRSSLARTLAGALGAAAPLAVLANPTGGQVVGGTATIGNAGANGLVINQGSQKAIINWQQFSVGSGEYVQFVQPNSSAVVLNRVIGSNPSSIFGNISANGQVFLVNPNGVYFAPGASLDVQGLVASTLDLNDADFMAGRYLFSKAPGAPDAGVVNGGNIHAGPGGYVVLAGDYAQNSGTIVAQTGRVYLAAGNAATLTFDQNQLISYVVDGKTLSRLAGVTNTGEIAADGGAVVMTADVANALTATAVNNSGLVTAHSAVNQGGTIVLLAQGGGIENSGTLDASGAAPGAQGGTVILHGDGHTQLDPTSVVDASGDGAKGGFIDLSGHTLHIGGQVDVGHGGTLLIDPLKLFITNGASSGGIITSGDYVGAQFIDNQLNLNNNVVLVASNSIKAFNPSAPGATGPATAITATGTGTLTIKTGTLSLHSGTAGHGSLMNFTTGAHCGSGVCTPNPGSATLNYIYSPTSGTINLTGLTINIKGAFTANALHGAVTLGAVTASAVTVTGGNIALQGNVTAAAGSVNISAVSPTGQVKITQAAANTIQANLAVSLNDSGTGGVNGASMTQINVGNVIAGGNVTLHAGQSNAAVNFASVNAGTVTGKNIVFHVDGGPISKLNVGNVTATGSAGISFMVQNFSRKLSVKTGNLNAAVKIHGFASGSGAVTFGAITAPKISFNASGKGDTIVTGALTAVSTAGAASISLNAAAGAGSGGVTVNGNVTVTGKTPAHPTAGLNDLPLAASLVLSGNASAGHVVAIHVNGAINVTANAGSFSVARSIGETSGMATLTTKGKGGAAAVNLNASGGQGSVAVTGSLSAKGPDGNVVVAANKITLGNVTVTGSGHTISRKLASAGSVNTFSSNNSAGQALLALVGAGTGPVVAASIKVGNIQLNGKGLALAFVEGTNVSAGSILATAATATGTRHIKGIKPHTTCLHACSQSFSGGVFRNFEGDALGSGHITGGRAVVAIGTGSSGSSKSAPAKSIKVGNVSVSGVGAADIGLFGSTLQTGNLSAIATKGSEQGAGSTHQLNALGTASTGLFKRSFKGTGGQAGIHLGGGAGGVTVAGNVTITGPTARAKIQGASVNVSGGLTAAASGGGSVSTDTVFTPKTGTGFHTHFTGPGRDNGLTMQATGAVNVGGLVKITGPGITGALIDGSQVTLGGLSGSDSGPGHYSILDTRVSPNTTSFTASSLGFVITDATTVAGATVFTPAAVNGNVTLKAKGGIYLPDELAVTGTFSAKAGGNIVGNGNGFILHIKDISNVAGHHGGSHSTSAGVNSASVPHLHLSAQAATFSAGGSIDLSGGQLTIGNGYAPGVTSDGALLAALAAKGLAPATQLPSGYFKAGTTLALGAITMSGDFLYLQGNAVAISGAVSVPAKSVVQVSPFSAVLPIDIENTTLLSKTGSFTFVNAAGTTNPSAFFGLTNQGFLSLFPGDTLVVGNSAEQAAVTIGANGKINLTGGTSLIIYSTGAVSGLGNVVTTGTVLSLETVLAPLPPPTPSEIDPNSSSNTNAADKKQQGEDTGTGQQGGTVSQSSDTGGACH